MSEISSHGLMNAWKAKNHGPKAGAIVLSDIIPIEIRGTYQSWGNLTYGLGSM